LDRPAAGARQLLAIDRAHAGAHEGEVGDGHRQRPAVDLDPARDQRLVDPCTLCRAPGAVGVALLADREAQRIGRSQVGIPRLKGAGIGQQLDALAGGQSKMVSALGANVERALQLAGVYQVAATGALAPQVVGYAGLLLVRAAGAEPWSSPEDEFSHESLAGLPRLAHPRSSRGAEHCAWYDRGPDGISSVAPASRASYTAARRRGQSVRKARRMASEVRFGVDIGGTFTDLLVFDTDSGRFQVGKTLTT